MRCVRKIESRQLTRSNQYDTINKYVFFTDMKSFLYRKYARVAQGIEHSPPKRRVGRSNRLAGASSGGKPSEIPKVFRFFHNLLEFEGGRFILHFKGGRFILSDLLIVVAVPLKSNCILSAP